MKYAGIKANDTVDGIGISVSFWTQGCPHHCQGCHNPETWSDDGGLNLPESYCEDVIHLLTKHGIKRNLSILGGEPLYGNNIEIVDKLIKEVKKHAPEAKIFIWTGYTYEYLVERHDSKIDSILHSIDVLIDGRFELENRDITLWLKGSPNQRVINMKKTLTEGKIVIVKKGDKL